MNQPLVMDLNLLGRFLAAGFALSLVLSFLVQLLHAGMRLAPALRWVGKRPVLFLAGAVLVETLLVVLAAATGSLVVGTVAGSLLVILFAYVNYLMHLYRDEPFVPRELVMALSIDQLMAMVSPLFVALLLLGLGAAVGICLLGHHVLPAVEWPRSLRVRTLAAGLLLLILFLTLENRWNPLRVVLQRCGGEFDTFRNNPTGSYRHNGFLLAFCSQIGTPLMYKPEGYGREAMDKLAKEYSGKAEAYNRSLSSGRGEEPPDIVFVMSESFSDPSLLEPLAFHPDPIPRLRRRMKGIPAGRALVPCYGGGTAHCEFEALTGFSIALCGGGSPYENPVAKRESFPSLARLLREQGYRTTALHPYTDKMYARPRAYRAMGFDEFLVQRDMTHTGRLENNPYISDEAAYREVLDLLDQEGKPRFIHLVTMQNHGEHLSGRYSRRVEVEGDLPERRRSLLSTYAQGLAYTDEATDWFLQAMEKRGRPSVVVFWGDHHPGGYTAGMLRELGDRKYQTPFFLWTSIPVEGVDLGICSPLYFRHLMATFSGRPKTPFDLLLSELAEEIHGIHTDFLLDRDGTPVSSATGRGAELLERYRMVQYDAIAGEGYGEKAGLYRIKEAGENP